MISYLRLLTGINVQDKKLSIKEHFFVGMLAQHVCWSMTLLLVVFASQVLARDALTLPQAELLALDSDPIVASREANQAALTDQAAAAYAWPDPKISLGVSNISTKTYDFEQEPMTQAVIGISQTFPPRGSVGAKRDQFLALANSEEYAIEDQKLQTLRSLRTNWFDVYYYHEAEVLVTQNLDAFTQLEEVTRFQYRAGRGNHHDVLQAQLEKSKIEDQIIEIHSQWESAIAQLKKWLGRSNFTQNLDMAFPDLPTQPNEAQLMARLEEHPWYLVTKARVTAAQNGVQFADAQYNSAWMLNLQYGYRGAERDDLASAMLVVDIPLFTWRKQGKLLSASQSDLQVSQSNLDDRYRQLLSMLEDAIAKFNRTVERIDLFDGSLLPQAKQSTEATYHAYQNGVTGFDVLVRARLTELDSKLQYLKLKVNRAKAQINLLYLAGG